MGARGCGPREVTDAGAWPWSKGDAAKNTRSKEKSEANGNSRLKTPLSSRELNSNVHVLTAGERDERRRREDAERRRQMCAHF